MPPPLILDPAQLDLAKVLANRDAIRRVNLHRYDMEQIDAIVLLDPQQHLIAGYKDVRADEFWVRGHFPELPLMPGVLICEAAAQLMGYYWITQRFAANRWVGFGGMEGVRFRGTVRPGDRLVLVGKGKRVRKIQSIFSVQGFVENRMVFHGELIGVPLNPQLNEG